MLKTLLTIAAMLAVHLAHAAIDVNTATEAELDSIKGIGPSVSTRILDERKKGHFTSWGDLMRRVKGVGGATATRFSAQGLTVNGAPYKEASPSRAASAQGQ